MLKAGIDIGTNSTRLLIARCQEGQISPVFTALETTRIGEGVGTTGMINPLPLARTLRCLEKYLENCNQYGVKNVRIAATSAVRDAKNKEEVAEKVYEKTGVKLEILTGEKEAELSYLGAISDLDTNKENNIMVLDIGGGSTELIHPGPEGIQYKSVNLGAVRLSENQKLLGKIPIILLDLIPKQPFNNPCLVGVGGTVTTLVAIKLGLEEYDPDLVHGHHLKIRDIKNISRKLQGMSLDERKKLRGLQPGRADIIPYGVLILEEVMELLKVSEITASEKDILYGMIISGGSGES